MKEHRDRSIFVLFGSLMILIAAEASGLLGDRGVIKKVTVCLHMIEIEFVKLPNFFRIV